MKVYNLSADLKEFIERSTTNIFLSKARQFVELLETPDINKNVFYSEAHVKLLELYYAGHKLDLIELKYSSAESEFKNDFENKNVNLISELGLQEYYWEVHDPGYLEMKGRLDEEASLSDKEASQGMLSDDFMDIYVDLKKSLSQIDKIETDEAIEDAFWQLKWGFSNHWGHHCINALRYLHYLNYDGKKTL